MHGFLHLPSQGVTNLAIRDLIAGLQWVQDEVAAFGGDPSNVTIWGQSAGAINIATLMGSPATTGRAGLPLFHKAIAVSGGPGAWSSVELYRGAALADMTAALQRAAPTLQLHESGEPLLEALQSLAPETIAKASAAVRDSMEAVHGVTTLPSTYCAIPDGEVPRRALDRCSLRARASCCPAPPLPRSSAHAGEAQPRLAASFVRALAARRRLCLTRHTTRSARGRQRACR